MPISNSRELCEIGQGEEADQEDQAGDQSASQPASERLLLAKFFRFGQAGLDPFEVKDLLVNSIPQDETPLMGADDSCETKAVDGRAGFVIVDMTSPDGPVDKCPAVRRDRHRRSATDFGQVPGCRRIPVIDG